jgi:putative ABC transport system ATP-binding protein
MAEPLLQLENAGRTYPGPPPVTALRGVDLSIHGGELVAIVGPSGCGKSTLLNILGLLDEPTSGSRRVAGRSTSGLRERELTALRAATIGFVFQAFHLVPHLDSLQNVALPLVHQGRSGRVRRVRAGNALQAVGMGHRTHARPSTLSGGEKQRVAIARALVQEPVVLLCDEPTGNLDSVNTSAVLELLRHLVAPERAVVVVTHDAAVHSHADRVVSMVDGCVS